MTTEASLPSAPSPSPGQHAADSAVPERARIVVMPASTRTGSINQTLAHQIAIEFEAQGEAVWVADLGESILAHLAVLVASASPGQGGGELVGIDPDALAGFVAQADPAPRAA